MDVNDRKENEDLESMSKHANTSETIKDNTDETSHPTVDCEIENNTENSMSSNDSDAEISSQTKALDNANEIFRSGDQRANEEQSLSSIRGNTDKYTLEESDSNIDSPSIITDSVNATENITLLATGVHSEEEETVLLHTSPVAIPTITIDSFDEQNVDSHSLTDEDITYGQNSEGALKGSDEEIFETDTPMESSPIVDYEVNEDNKSISNESVTDDRDVTDGSMVGYTTENPTNNETTYGNDKNSLEDTSADISEENSADDVFSRSDKIVLNENKAIDNESKGTLISHNTEELSPSDKTRTESAADVLGDDKSNEHYEVENPDETKQYQIESSPHTNTSKNTNTDIETDNTELAGEGNVTTLDKVYENGESTGIVLESTCNYEEVREIEGGQDDSLNDQSTLCIKTLEPSVKTESEPITEYVLEGTISELESYQKEFLSNGDSEKDLSSTDNLTSNESVTEKTIVDDKADGINFTQKASEQEVFITEIAGNQSDVPLNVKDEELSQSNHSFDENQSPYDRENVNDTELVVPLGESSVQDKSLVEDSKIEMMTLVGSKTIIDMQDNPANEIATVPEDDKKVAKITENPSLTSINDDENQETKATLAGVSILECASDELVEKEGGKEIERKQIIDAKQKYHSDRCKSHASPDANKDNGKSIEKNGRKKISKITQNDKKEITTGSTNATITGSTDEVTDNEAVKPAVTSNDFKQEDVRGGCDEETSGTLIDSSVCNSIESGTELSNQQHGYESNIYLNNKEKNLEPIDNNADVQKNENDERLTPRISTEYEIESTSEVTDTDNNGDLSAKVHTLSKPCESKDAELDLTTYKSDKQDEETIMPDHYETDFEGSDSDDELELQEENDDTTSIKKVVDKHDNYHSDNELSSLQTSPQFFSDESQNCVEVNGTEHQADINVTSVWKHDVVSSELDKIKSYLKTEQEKLSSSSLKEYNGKEMLIKLLNDVSSTIEKFKNELETVEKSISGINTALLDIFDTINIKLKKEDLMAWVTKSPPGLIDAEVLARRQLLMAEANSSKTDLAEAEVRVAETISMYAQLQIETKRLFLEAEDSRIKAEETKIKIEESKRAAEQKQLKNEEDQMKREEQRKQHELEELKAKEEECRRIEELERIKGSKLDEDEIKNMENYRKDPKNWTPFIYEIEPGDFDQGIGCVVRAMSGYLEKDDLTCTIIDQVDSSLVLGENEQLVSNIVKLEAVHPGQSFRSSEAWAVAIPHASLRSNVTREPVVKILEGDGTWKELPTKDAFIQDLKELRFVEVRVKGPITYAVVSKLRTDAYHMSKRGCKLVSSIDSRVSLTFKPCTFRLSTSFIMRVQQVDSGLINELRRQRIDEDIPSECDPLLASSPILHLNFRHKKFMKTVTVTLPVPHHAGTMKRPTTAAPAGIRSKPTPDTPRPVSAMFTFGTLKTTEDEDDRLDLLIREDSKTWAVVPDVEFVQPKNKDIVTFELQNPSARLMILRTRETTPAWRVEKIAHSIERALMEKSVQVILRQRASDPCDVIMTCVSSKRTQKAMRRLADESFDDGPNASKEFILSEGQVLDIRFRGNIKNCDDAQTLRLVYNTQLRDFVNFGCMEIDSFAQKSINVYRGFAQVYTKGLVQKPVYEDDNKKGQPVRFEWVKGDKLLCELLINIPKPEMDSPTPSFKVPVKIDFTEGLLDDVLLKHVARELGDEWKRLGSYLNIRRARVQAILRDNVKNTEPHFAAYDMLLTWLKKVPRSLNKADVLCNSLIKIGRVDLSHDIREKEVYWKQMTYDKTKGAKLRRVIMQVSQNPRIFKNWLQFSGDLGLSEAEVSEVDHNHMGLRKKTYHALEKWMQREPSASVSTLVEHLKKTRYMGEVQSAL